LLVRDLQRPRPLLPLVFAPLSFGLTVASLVVPALRFSLDQRALAVAQPSAADDVWLPSSYANEWTYFNLGTAPAPATEGAAVARLLSVWYYGCCVTVPVALTACLALAALLPNSRARAALYWWANVLGPWSCLDVVLVACLLLANDFARLINALIYAWLACPGGADNINLRPRSEVLLGSWLLLAAVPVTYVAQVIGARAMHTVRAVDVATATTLVASSCDATKAPSTNVATVSCSAQRPEMLEMTGSSSVAYA